MCFWEQVGREGEILERGFLRLVLYSDQLLGIFYQIQAREGNIYPIKTLCSNIHFQDFLWQTVSNQKVDCNA